MAFLRIVSVVAPSLALAACTSKQPTREEGTREAGGRAVRTASDATAAGIDTVLSEATRELPALTPIATYRLDICHVGQTNGFHGHDGFRLRCRRDVTRYFAADGEVIDRLRELDAAAKATGWQVYDPIANIDRYYAANGMTPDGRALPQPALGYISPAKGWRIHVGWSKVDDPREHVPDPGLGGPVVRYEVERVDLDALWAGPLRDRRHLITLSILVDYHETPWTD